MTRTITTLAVAAATLAAAAPAGAAPAPYRSHHRLKAHVARSTWSAPALTVKW